MKNIIAAAIASRRTTLVFLLMLVFAGLFARANIPIEADPRVEVPYFVVRVIHEGISPEDAQRLLIMPIEEELRSVEGIKEVTAYASEGLATVAIEFDPDQDLDSALLDVRESVDRARAEMPSTAEEPQVIEQSTDDWPLIEVNVTGDVPERQLYQLALSLKEDIEALPAVLEVQLRGHREEVLEAVIDPVLLESYELSVDQLVNNIVQNNRLIPAGALETGDGRFSVKVPSVIEEARDLYDLPVKADGESVITLAQVAKVRRTFKDRTGYARVNGSPTISLGVIKRSGSNVVDTSERVRAVVEAARSNFPSRVQVFCSQDQAEFAKQQVDSLEGNILTALALVMVLVVAALGIRSGIIVGLAIPFSFLVGLSVLYVQGMTFNIMVMFGMLLALGMLIDGAIVVTEYADRKMADGMDRRSAYADAAERMFWPVTASIATTLAAFLPLLFWPGIMGKFMSYLPVTVFAVLIGSLFYALYFGPTLLGATFGTAPRPSPKQREQLRILETGDPTQLRTITGYYARLMRLLARYSPITLLVTLGVLYASFVAYGQYGKGVIYFNEADPIRAIVQVKARGNLSPDTIAELVTEVEELILAVPGIRDLNTSTSLGGGGGGMFFGGGGSDSVGRMFLELHDEVNRELSGYEVLDEVRARTADLAGISVEVRAMEYGPPVGKPIYIEFSSPSGDGLNEMLQRTRHFMENQDGLVDIDDSGPVPGIEWSLQVDRAQAALYGANVTAVGSVVQFLTAGLKVGEYRPDDAEEAVDIRVRFPDDERGVAALDDLRVVTPAGQVPISSFVTRVPNTRTDLIERVDGRIVESISANVRSGVLADDKVKELRSWMDQQELPAGVTVRFRGADEEQQATGAFIAMAFPLALLLMLVLLVTQFNNFYQAALILFAVVMSTAGVLMGLLLFDQPFSSALTGTGIVALAGIVVNNNIVLIDTYNHLKREHPGLHYADLIARTGAQRLRPVALTTLTTVLGLLPMALGISIDLISREVIVGGQIARMWEPLAQAVVSGLTFATVLTLLSTPAMLALPHQLRNLRERIFSRSTAATSPAA